MTKRTAKLALEDGSVFTGRAFGAPATAVGEVVFTTSMTGYQETLTDPSYRGQIVCMTYPHVGNVGVNADDEESGKPQVQGYIVRELTAVPSSYRAQTPLDQYLRDHGIPGIAGIDTRALVRRLRVRGAMAGVLAVGDHADAALVEQARAAPQMLGRDLVKEVVPPQAFAWAGGVDHPLAHDMLPVGEGRRRRVVALDYGMKWNIPRCLTQAGCDVTVVPGTASARDVLALQPDGVFLSNGPGDPGVLDYAIQTIRTLAESTPIFGICLGHQLLGLALGGKTFKLKFGHRGANQPVLNLLTQRVEITTQNHGFAVDIDSLPADVEATHVNLNDRTLEGLRHRERPLFSVQYHPESSAGPHDSTYLFAQFRQAMDERR